MIGPDRAAWFEARAKKEARAPHHDGSSVWALFDNFPQFRGMSRRARDLALPAEHASAAVERRHRAFRCNQLWDLRPIRFTCQDPSLIVEPLQHRPFFGLAEFRF